MNNHSCFLTITLTIICVFISFSCSIQEKSIEVDDSLEIVQINPVVAFDADSVIVTKVKSAIQSSSEYILASYTVYKSGKYIVEITEEEMLSLGITQEDYHNYVNGVLIMNGSNETDQ